MILQIARRVREISNHTNQLGTVTDACLSAIPVVVLVQGRRQPLCGSRYSQQFHELPIQWGLWHPLFQRKPSGQLRLVRETINHEDQKGFERGAENDASWAMRLRSFASQGFLPVETRQPSHFFFFFIGQRGERHCGIPVSGVRIIKSFYRHEALAQLFYLNKNPVAQL